MISLDDKKVRWVAVEGGFEIYDGQQLLGIIKENQVRRPKGMGKSSPKR